MIYDAISPHTFLLLEELSHNCQKVIVFAFNYNTRIGKNTFTWCLKETSNNLFKNIFAIKTNIELFVKKIHYVMKNKTTKKR